MEERQRRPSLSDEHEDLIGMIAELENLGFHHMEVDSLQFKHYEKVVRMAEFYGRMVKRSGHETQEDLLRSALSEDVPDEVA